MPTWPATLPPYPLFDGYEEEPQSKVLRSKMDAGPPKTRRRFTAGTENITAQFLMTNAQLAIFEAFFEDDLESGSLTFNITNPRNTAETLEVMIVGEPPFKKVPVSGTHWRVHMTLEVQP